MVISSDNVGQILSAIASTTTKSITSAVNPHLAFVRRVEEYRSSHTDHDRKVRSILRRKDISCSRLISTL